jgi:hypothetical protein
MYDVSNRKHQRAVNCLEMMINGYMAVFRIDYIDSFEIED